MTSIDPTSATPDTRVSLLLRLQDGQNQEAWGEFVAMYEPLIRRVALGSGLQDADARDVTQQVLLIVSGHIENWDADRARGSLRGWLARVSRNLTVNLLIQQRRHGRGSGDSDIQRLIEQEPDPSAGETAEFDVQYRRRTFQWAAEKIRAGFHEKTWQAFWRTSVATESIPDVAEKLGMSVGAVYVARSRVIAKLRDTIRRLEIQQKTI